MVQETGGMIPGQSGQLAVSSRLRDRTLELHLSGDYAITFGQTFKAKALLEANIGLPVHDITKCLSSFEDGQGPIIIHRNSGLQALRHAAGVLFEYVDLTECTADLMQVAPVAANMARNKAALASEIGTMLGCVYMTEREPQVRTES